MATKLTLRNTKGSPLTFQEGDDNFIYVDEKATAGIAIGKVYDTKEAGLAAVRDTDTFWVQGSGDIGAILYRRVNSTTATELKRVLSDQFKADLADPAKGAAMVAIPRRGVGAIDKTLAEAVLYSEINLLEYANPADGDGMGGGTDFTQAFANAYLALSESGGGTLRVPMSGTGNYRVDGAIEPPSNTLTIVEDGVVIDFTSRPPGGVNGHSILIQGQFVGAEIPIGVNANRGDLQISTATPHGLTAGDWFLLKSQRNALHSDAGENWRLGTPTGNPDAHACYFGEPCQVSEVVSSTVVKISKGLIFPNYRTDNSQETSILARPSATIQKMAFKENVRWHGGRFLNNGTTVFLLDVTSRCMVTEIHADLGSKTGAAIVNRYGLENKFFRVSAEHSPIDYIVEDHSRYNSFKELSSWFSQWDYEDRYGAQGFDGTYVINGTCSICPTITGASYDAHEQGLTFHAGTYGFLIKNIRAYRAKQAGLTIRSRFGVIDNPYIIGPNINQLGGISFTGWGVDCSVNGGYIEGYHSGVSVGAEQGDESTFPQPLRKNITVDGTSIRRVNRGVLATTHYSTPIANSEPSGVIVRNLRLAEVSEYGVRLGQYCNYAQVENIYIESLANGAEGVSVAANSVGHIVNNVIGDKIQPEAALIRTYGITDNTTFPAGEWSSSRIKIGYYKNRGSKVSCVNLNPTSIDNIRADGYVFDHRDQDDTIIYNSASNGTWTIPFSASVFPVGARITVVNLGGATLTISPAPGITIGAPSGATLGQNQVATLLKIALTTWVMVK